MGVIYDALACNFIPGTCAKLFAEWILNHSWRVNQQETFLIIIKDSLDAYSENSTWNYTRRIKAHLEYFKLNTNLTVKGEEIFSHNSSLPNRGPHSPSQGLQLRKHLSSCKNWYLITADKKPPLTIWCVLNWGTSENGCESLVFLGIIWFHQILKLPFCLPQLAVANFHLK